MKYLLILPGVLVLLVLIAVIRTLVSPRKTSGYQPPQTDEAEALRLADVYKRQDQGKLTDEEKKNLSFVIWTTTIWTLPGNLAIALNPVASYVIVRNNPNGEQYLVAEALMEKVMKVEMCIRDRGYTELIGQLHLRESGLVS